MAFRKVSAITEKLDLADTQAVSNVIKFEGSGKFTVVGSTNIVDGDNEYDRVAFEFTNAIALVWGKRSPASSCWYGLV